MPEEVFQQTPELDRFYQRRGIGQYRRWFRDAVDYWRKWHDEAKKELTRVFHCAKVITLNIH